MPSPLRVTLSADPVEGRVLPSGVFARPPAGPSVVRMSENHADDDRRERTDGPDRAGERFGAVRIDAGDDRRGWNGFGTGGRQAFGRSDDDGAAFGRGFFRSNMLTSRADALQVKVLMTGDGLPLLPPSGFVLAAMTRANVLLPRAAATAAEAAEPPTDGPPPPILPRAVAAEFFERMVAAVATAAPPANPPVVPVPAVNTVGEPTAGVGGPVPAAVASAGQPAAVPPAGSAPMAEQPPIPLDVPPPQPDAVELPSLPAQLLAVPGVMLNIAGEVLPSAAPLIGVLPTDAAAIEETAAALVFHVAALTDALPDAVSGPEGYAWVAAGVCLAGGLAFSVRGRHVRRPAADPVTLGTDSVFALESRRDTDLL